MDRHENALAVLNADGSIKEATTNVAELAEFAARKTTKTIDGQSDYGLVCRRLHPGRVEKAARPGTHPGDPSG